MNKSVVVMVGVADSHDGGGLTIGPSGSDNKALSSDNIVTYPVSIIN